MKTTCKVLINGMSNPLEFLKSDVSPSNKASHKFRALWILWCYHVVDPVKIPCTSCRMQTPINPTQVSTILGPWMYWMTLPAFSTTSSNPKGNQSEGRVNQSSQWHFSPLTDQWVVPYLCQLNSLHKWHPSVIAEYALIYVKSQIWHHRGRHVDDIKNWCKHPCILWMYIH